MLDKIAQIVGRYEEIERQMTDPQVLADHTRLTALAQERSDIQPLVAAYRRYQELLQQRQDAEELVASESEADIVAMFREEVAALDSKIDALLTRMKKLLIPGTAGMTAMSSSRSAPAPVATRPPFLPPICSVSTPAMPKAATGRLTWSTATPSASVDSRKSRSASRDAALSRGSSIESGVHRVQRVPTTESQGRIHTSTATVAVMPEIDDVEVTLDERDLEITATFSSGPGGQHMQKNATAARVIHKPSGIMVKVQTERSLTQNKRLAMAIIQSRLQQQEEDKQAAAIAANRKSQVGSGDRAEKIRTYNYPQNRVTDHRIGMTTYNLSNVMEGSLDDFIDALIIADQAEKLAALED